MLLCMRNLKGGRKFRNLMGIVKSWVALTTNRCLFRSQSSIYDEAFFAKVVNGQNRLTIFTKKVHRRCSMDLNSLWWSYFPILLKVSDFLINTYTGTLKPHQNFYNVSKVFFVLKVNLLKGVILGSITTPKYFQNKFKDPRAKNENHAVY